MRQVEQYVSGGYEALFQERKVYRTMTPPKDEIAEKSAEECAKLDPYKFTTRQYVESLSTIIAEACRKARKTEQLSAIVADLTNEYKWSWTRMISQRNAVQYFLSLLSSHGLIEHAPHPLGGNIWRIDGKIYGRTDGIDPKTLTPKETKV